MLLEHSIISIACVKLYSLLDDHSQVPINRIFSIGHWPDGFLNLCATQRTEALLHLPKKKTYSIASEKFFIWMCSLLTVQIYDPTHGHWTRTLPGGLTGNEMNVCIKLHSMLQCQWISQQKNNKKHLIQFQMHIME